MSEPTGIWHTFPLGLVGADQTGRDRTSRGSLRDLTGWLPHVSSLGADTLLLGPIFASLSHGYDTVTHHEIDDRLGDVEDLLAVIAAARQRGIGIVLDGVFAYVSRRFWRLEDPAEADTPWLARDDQGALVPWRVDSLITPDYDSPGYRSYVVDVMSAWLDLGVVGWRLDSAWSVPNDFWRNVLGRVRRTHPAAWFLGQVFDDELPACDRRGDLFERHRVRPDARRPQLAGRAVRSRPSSTRCGPTQTIPPGTSSPRSWAITTSPGSPTSSIRSCCRRPWPSC